MSEENHLGGQALIEGVLIKSKNKIAKAVRKQDKILLKVDEYISLTEKSRFLKLPLIRGCIILGEMMVYGMSALIWSANQQEEKETISSKEIAWSVIISVTLAVGLFVIAPYFITKIFVQKQGLFFNFIDGLIRLGFFFSYLLVISRMNDIQRVFQYHGAEHMAVHCYESGKKLTVKNIRQFPTMHPRCGTAFLMFVFIISIFVFSIVRFDMWYYNILGRILFIPLITGISYEFIKFSHKYERFRILKPFMMPGIWMQYITTKQPDDKQIEVAINAVKGAL